METYRSIEAEKRDGDENTYAKWNRLKNKDTDREYFQKRKSNKKKQFMDKTEGKTVDKKDWKVKTRVKRGDEDVKAERTDPYKDYTPKRLFKDFDFIDADKIGGKPRKRRSKKAKSRKTAKPRSRKAKPKSRKAKSRSRKTGGVKTKRRTRKKTAKRAPRRRTSKTRARR